MSISFRNYKSPEDYWKISEFLIENYQPGNQDGNWVEPGWEYMHGHPALQPAFLPKIGIWEEDGEIVAVINFEEGLGDAFFQFKSGYRHLRTEMLDYAEKNLLDEKGDLNVYINDFDPDTISMVEERGYQRSAYGHRPTALFTIADPYPEIVLPEGYHLQSLADEPDWAKVHRVMWRGFDHGEVPKITQEDMEMRRKMFDTVTADLDLKIVVAAPNGDFVSICGMFYQPDNRFAYVEPVATDADYRRMGLGKATVLEGIRRCTERGAVEAIVGSDQLFYQALGFEVKYYTRCWQKKSIS
jgi:GNAT superfamily N-acetyltransferase